MIIDQMQMLRMRNVTSLTGLSRSLIYRLIAEGTFPRPVRMSARASAWPRAAVLGYIQRRAQLSGVQLPPAVPAAPGKDDDTTGASTRTQYRSEEHTSELQSLMRISYAVFCLKKQKTKQTLD